MLRYAHSDTRLFGILTSLTALASCPAIEEPESTSDSSDSTPEPVPSAKRDGRPGDQGHEWYLDQPLSRRSGCVGGLHD